MSILTIRKAAALLCVLFLLAGLAGCGPRTEESESGSEAPSWKKTVTVGTDGPVKTLDPQKISNAAHDTVFRMIYDTLLEYDAESGSFVPGLALSWRWEDDSCSALRLTLREGVVFQNGDPFTAEDVKATLDRVTNSTVKASYASSEVLGDHEILIRLSGTNADFPFHLAACTTAIVSAKAVAADEEQGARIGTGPWKLLPEETVAGDTVTLVRNDSYWGEKPVTDKLVLRYYSNDSARLVALENGEIDCCVTLAYNEIAAAEENKALSVHVYVGTGLNYLAFNTTSDKGSNEKLRLALAYAIDRAALVEAVGDPAGEAAVTLFSRAAGAYRTEFAEDRSYQPEKAKALAAELEDPSVKLMVNTSIQSYRTMAEAIQEQCRQAGIRVTLEEVDASGLTAASKFGSATHELLLYTIYLNDYNSDISRLLNTGNSTNKASLTDETVLELLAAGRAAADAEEAGRIYGELQELVNEHCWYIPLFYGSGCVAWQEGTEGVVISENARHDFRYIRVPER